MAEIRIDVESQTVHTHPSAQMNPDGTNLSRRIFSSPYTSIFLDTSSLHPEVSHGPNHNFFEGPDIAVNVGKEKFQIEDGIGDQLTRPVIRNIPATVDPMKRNPLIL